VFSVLDEVPDTYHHLSTTPGSAFSTQTLLFAFRLSAERSCCRVISCFGEY